LEIGNQRGMMFPGRGETVENGEQLTGTEGGQRNAHPKSEQRTKNREKRDRRQVKTPWGTPRNRFGSENGGETGEKGPEGKENTNPRWHMASDARQNNIRHLLMQCAGSYVCARMAANTRESMQSSFPRRSCDINKGDADFIFAILCYVSFRLTMAVSQRGTTVWC
jgi:hypothetical protein